MRLPLKPLATKTGIPLFSRLNVGFQYSMFFFSSCLPHQKTSLAVTPAVKVVHKTQQICSALATTVKNGLTSETASLKLTVEHKLQKVKTNNFMIKLCLTESSNEAILMNFFYFFLRLDVSVLAGHEEGEGGQDCSKSCRG